MRRQPPISHSLQALFLFLSSFASASGFAQAPASEPALTQSAADAQLAWEPCPFFLPEGCAMAVLHIDPAQENLDVFFKLPPRASIPPHWHNSAQRMVLVAGELQLTYEDQKTAVLHPGTYAYGPAKRPHKGYCASAVPCVLFVAYEARLDASCSVEATQE